MILEDHGITYTPAKREPRFPVEPLLLAAARLAGLGLCPQALAQHRNSNCPACSERAHYGLRALARDAGVSEDLPRLWAMRGISEEKADRAACAIGLHPAIVWGAVWWAVEGELVAQWEERPAKRARARCQTAGQETLVLEEVS